MEGAGKEHFEEGISQGQEGGGRLVGGACTSSYAGSKALSECRPSRPNGAFGEAEKLSLLHGCAAGVPFFALESAQACQSA